MTSGKDFVDFQQYYWLTYSQSYLKKFTATDKMEKELCLEKLLVCVAIVMRSIADKDDIIYNAKEGFKGICISNEEINFLSKDTYPPSFVKYVQKEDWFKVVMR